MQRSNTHYVPILKARLGEFTAASRSDPEIAGNYTPLFECVPSGQEFDDEGEALRPGLENSVQLFGDRLQRYWPGSKDLIVDTHALPNMQDLYPIVELMDRFGPQDPLIPACRPVDTDDPGLIEALREALGRYESQNICIRLSDEDIDERDEPIAESLDRVLNQLEVAPESVDIVIDFGAVTNDSINLAARVARLVIIDLPRLDEWRSITLAAGSFPSNLTSDAPYTINEHPRLEVNLWRTVRDRLRDRMRMPSFGDYAIAYPQQLAGVPFAPAPQIRYTTPENWIVLKGRRTNRRGSAQFFDICGQIVNRPEFTRDLSWGDRTIASKAEYAGVEADQIPTGVTSGNAMSWRAIGTSHHFALVIDRLTTQGEP